MGDNILGSGAADDHPGAGALLWRPCARAGATCATPPLINVFSTGFLLWRPCARAGAFL